MNTLTYPEALPRKAISSPIAPAAAGAARPLRRLRTSAEWQKYFEANAARPCEIPWHLGAAGVAQNLAAIASSLPAWQLGESSDGRRLIAVAEDHAERMADPHFVEPTWYFIREEQRHGAELGRWLDLAGVPRARRDWGDSCFRTMRYALPNLESWTTPVVMIEALAMVYYAAIRRATGSPVLRALCTRILSDEIPHLRFQSERLAAIHRHRRPLLLAFTMLLHRILFTGIVLAVWSAHSRALRAGHLTFRSYWRASWARMRHTWRAMDPQRYSLGEA